MATATYTGPANSEADYLRFMLGDTNVVSPILTDIELNYIVDTTVSNSATYRLAVAFRAAASALGPKLVKRSLGPQTEDATARHKYYVSEAEKYEKLSKFSGTPPLPTYSGELVFDKDMMGNA